MSASPITAASSAVWPVSITESAYIRDAGTVSASAAMPSLLGVSGTDSSAASGMGPGS